MEAAVWTDPGGGGRRGGGRETWMPLPPSVCTAVKAELGRVTGLRFMPPPLGEANLPSAVELGDTVRVLGTLLSVTFPPECATLLCSL